jgi:hypothetical protein
MRQRLQHHLAPLGSFPHRTSPGKTATLRKLAQDPEYQVSAGWRLLTESRQRQISCARRAGLSGSVDDLIVLSNALIQLRAILLIVVIYPTTNHRSSAATFVRWRESGANNQNAKPTPAVNSAALL